MQQQLAPQVQRTAILHTIEQQLLELAAGPASARILNLYGITGIGKTVALQQIFEQVRTTAPVLWLDFDAERMEPEHPTLIRQPFAALVSWLSQQLNELAYLPTELPPGTEQQQVGVASARLSPAATQPFVLLLDHLDNLAAWQWVQAEIIKPLVEQRTTLVICASQSPLFWHFWELRELSNARPLDPLSEPEVADFLRQAERELLTESVLHLTQGYPLQLNALRPVLLTADPAEPEATAAPDLDGILERLSPLTRHLLRYTGLLRRLEVPAMQHILNHVLPDWVGKGQTPHYLLLGHMLPELRDQGHLAPYRRNQGQQLHRPLRLALDARLRNSEPARYAHICSLLSSFYEQQVMQKPIHEQQLLNEWLYFSTAALYEPPTGTDRDEWLAQAARLFARARLAGKSLLVWFYRDRELLARLHALGLTEPIQALIQKHFGHDHQAPPILNNTELVQYRRRLIEQWSAHPALADLQSSIPGGLFTLLETIATLGLSFSASTLRKRLNERPEVNVSHATVNQAIAQLERYSLLSHDRERRVYQLSGHIHGLLTEGTAAMPLTPSIAATETGSVEGGTTHG
jgi:hypothetical protein